MPDPISTTCQQYGWRMTVPTVDDLLARTHLGFGFHEWSTDADVFRVTRDELRQALEDAYDPTMPNWPAMVEIDA
jgi:hypothetical protein